MSLYTDETPGPVARSEPLRPEHGRTAPRRRARTARANGPDILTGEARRRLERTPVRIYAGGAKRVLDVGLVLAMALPVLAVVLILAAMVARDGGRPFFRQERIGRGGRVYGMWKLRTMCEDADAVLAAHLDTDPAARAEWLTTQKLRDDPRITAVGRVLRRSSLDELPQLWNVLRGDMSLVGPRPMMPQQRELYPRRAFALAYCRARPGLTGPWQVSSRNLSSFADRAGFDTQYVRTLSFVSDVRLLTRTVGVVFRGTGC